MDANALGWVRPRTAVTPARLQTAEEICRLLQGKVETRHLEELAAIGREADGEMFFHGLLQFGVRLKQDSRLEAAAALFEMLEKGIPGVSKDLRETAQREYEALVGRGSAARRCEFWVGQLGSEFIDAKSLLPVIGASALGQTVQTVVWGRWLAGGWTARLAGSVAGYAVEFSALTLSHRALGMGHGEGWGDTLRRAAIFFGAARVFQGFGQRIFGKLDSPFHRETLNSLALFGGLLTAARMGSAEEDATLATDALASMASMALGFQWASRWLGPSLARLRAESALRSQTRAAPPRSYLDEAAPSPASSAPVGLLRPVKDGIPGIEGMVVKMVAPASQPPLPLDRRMQTDVAILSEQVRQLPTTHPSQADLFATLERIRNEGFIVGRESEFYEKLQRFEEELTKAWRYSLEQRVQSAGELLRRLAEEGQDAALSGKVQRFLASERELDYDGIRAKFYSFDPLFLQTLSQATEREWKRGSSGTVPPGLIASANDVFSNVLRLGLLQSPLGAADVREFLGELVGFYRNYPPFSPLHLLPLSPRDVRPDRILLPRAELKAGDYLSSIAQNLRGHRRLFGKDADLIFYEQALLVSPLPSVQGEASSYFLTVQKGQHEFINGLRMAIFDKPPHLLNPNAYLAKVGINFRDDALRIVAVQGAHKFDYEGTSERPKGYVDLEAFLAASPLDMLTASAIFLARQAGFARVEGIRDRAQLARENHYSKKNDRGFYDLLFRKFGFQPPSAGSDYWTLDLENLRIRRKRSVPQGTRPAIVQHLAERRGGVGLSLGEYFREVLIRRNRDWDGKNIRPEKWDRQEPYPLAPPVLAFWKILAPALSAADYRPAVSSDPLRRQPNGRPFQFADLRRRD